MKNCNVLDFGVKENCKEIQTDKIQAALDFVAGGGTVTVPKGVYYTATLRLNSNTTLKLEKGAVLKGSDKYSDYRGNGEFNSELGEVVSLLYGLNSDNIKICGEGVIDCNGEAFAYMDTPRKILHKNIEISEMTAAQISDAVVEYHEKRPNQLLFFQNCKGLDISGITVVNAPCWTVVLNKCSNSKLHHFKIDNDLRLCNSDGIHLCGCKDIEINDNTFLCGDDCIALTGIIDWNAFNEDIYIHDCNFTSRSAAIRVGHYASKNRNIKFERIHISDTNRAIVFILGKDGFIENVDMNDIEVGTRIHGGAWWGNAEALVVCNDGGVMRNIKISNIKGNVENGIFLHGKLQDFVIENVNLKIAYGVNRPLFDKGIDFQPYKLEEKQNDSEVYKVYSEEVSGVVLNNIKMTAVGEKAFKLIDMTK